MRPIIACQVCGHIEFGEAPENCPVCFAEKENFKEDAYAIHPSEKEGKEKHVPVIVSTKACGLIPDLCQDVHVKVGAVPHPMEREHWIEWIDLYLNKIFMSRTIMWPQSLQAASGIHIKAGQTGTLTAIESCNKHGRWMAETEL